MLWRYDSQRRRVWVLGARIHHGALGVALVVVGAWLIWDDRRDFPWLQDAH